MEEVSQRRFDINKPETILPFCLQMTTWKERIVFEAMINEINCFEGPEQFLIKSIVSKVFMRKQIIFQEKDVLISFKIYWHCHR